MRCWRRGARGDRATGSDDFNGHVRCWRVTAAGRVRVSPQPLGASKLVGTMRRRRRLTRSGPDMMDRSIRSCGLKPDPQDDHAGPSVAPSASVSVRRRSRRPERRDAHGPFSPRSGQPSPSPPQRKLKPQGEMGSARGYRLRSVPRSPLKPASAAPPSAGLNDPTLPLSWPT